eukprot:TRINITY_DN92750_c0_g1_i1.p1 TRINITY_DN92750_c0_g1~~TRINITY_DN92750_c0_g1_i1.p1  ORF type:complete len:434 (+),score=64.13 TRINITY_DN92750_c0_g1_i1:78-1379(+)
MALTKSEKSDQQNVELALAQKESIASKLVMAEFMFVTAVAMVIPTRAPMVLDIKKGDAAATARVLGLMSSCAAAIELFINPVFGQLSDMFGRKSFFLIAPAIDAFLHTLVAIFPKSLAVTFVDRMISGAMIFAFKAPLTASLSDLFSGPQLASWLAKQGAAFGLGLGLGPFIGSKLGGPKSFLFSSVTFVATMVYAFGALPETLKLEDRRKELSLAACSPLRFLKLFQDRMLSTLAVAIGLQSFGDYLNLYDINYLYLKTVFDVGQTEVGRYASACGVSQVISGLTMSRSIRSAGQKGATAFANAMWIVSMGLLGTATSVKQIILSLFAMCFGHLRNSGIAAYIQKHGQAQGMGRSEIAAAQANLLAVLKVFIPVFYSNIFSFATSKGRNVPGAPYLVVGLLTGLAQLTFSAVDPDQDVSAGPSRSAAAQQKV